MILKNLVHELYVIPGAGLYAIGRSLLAGCRIELNQLPLNLFQRFG